MDKVKECIYKSGSCRGCKYSFNPSLYDGGCMLHYKAVGVDKSPEEKEAGNDREPHA